MKKLSTQFINSIEGAHHDQRANQTNQFDDGGQQENFSMAVKSCRPNLYNKHRLIISQRDGTAPY